MPLELESDLYQEPLLSAICDKSDINLKKFIEESKDSFYVYILRDPRKNRQPMYVGKGRRNRIFEHLIGEHYNPILGRKLAKIKSVGMLPIVDIVYLTRSEKQAFLEETRHISTWGRIDLGTGCLCNMTNGGEGMAGHVKSAKAREVARQHVIKLNSDPTFRKRSSDRMHLLNARPDQIETRRKLNKQKIAVLFSDPTYVEEHKLRSSENLKLLHMDPVFRQKQSEAARKSAIIKRRRELHDRFLDAGLLEPPIDTTAKMLVDFLLKSELTLKELSSKIGLSKKVVSKIIFENKPLKTKHTKTKITRFLELLPT